jgi:hypothetical protein
MTNAETLNAAADILLDLPVPDRAQLAAAATLIRTANQVDEPADGDRVYLFSAEAASI